MSNLTTLNALRMTAIRAKGYTAAQAVELAEATEEAISEVNSAVTQAQTTANQAMALAENLAQQVAALQNLLLGEISGNSFSVVFSTLDNADVEGVWNSEAARLEF